MGCSINCNGQKTADAEAQQYASCAGVPLNRPITDAQIQTYLDRVQTDSSSRCYATAVLKAGRLIYWKKKPGDCGSKTSINLGASVPIAKGLGYATAGVSAAAGISGISMSAIEGPLALIGLPIAAWSYISQHHAVAVAREQETLCSVSTAYNQFAAGTESALEKGSITLTQARQGVTQAENTLMKAMNAIKKQCDFACGMEYALQALDLYNVEVYYPTIVATGSIPSANSSLLKTGGIIAAGVGIAHFGLGMF